MILNMYYNEFQHMGMSQMFTGAGDYFRPSEPHSGTLCITITIPLHTPGLVLCPTELVKCRLQAARQMGVTGAGVIRTVRCS